MSKVEELKNWFKEYNHQQMVKNGEVELFKKMFETKKDDKGK